MVFAVYALICSVIVPVYGIYRLIKILKKEVKPEDVRQTEEDT